MRNTKKREGFERTVSKIFYLSGYLDEACNQLNAMHIVNAESYAIKVWEDLKNQINELDND